MKVFFLSPYTISESDGISKKIIAQCKGFTDNGVDLTFCYLKVINNKLYYVINGIPISCIGRGKLKHIFLRCKFNAIYKYIQSRHFDMLYIRYVHIASPFMISFLRKVHNLGIKIMMEIPTFPYDQEYENSSIVNDRKVLKEGFQKVC